MCRPGRGSLRDPSTGGHIGPPLHGVEGIPNQRKIGAKADLANGAGRSPPPTEEWKQTSGGVRPGGRRGEVTPPYGCNTGGAQQRADVVIGPYGEKGKFPQIPGVAAHSGAFAARSQGMGGNCGRDHPQGVQQRRTIPQSRRSRDSSLYTREPCPAGDADCRVASLLAMTVLILCHSEEAQRADVGIRPFYDGRWTGVRAAGSSAPTKRRDSCRNHPSQRRTAERLRQRM